MWKYYWLMVYVAPTCITMPNFIIISHSIVEILQFFDFWNWWPSTILDLFGAYFDNYGEYLVVSISVQNLVMIDAVVWTIRIFQYLACLARKCIFTPLKLGFWDYLTPERVAISTKTKKGTPLHESISFEPLSVKIWRVVWPVGEILKKGDTHWKYLWYFTYFPRSPPWTNFHQILHCSRSRWPNHLCQIFSDRLRDANSMGRRVENRLLL